MCKLPVVLVRSIRKVSEGIIINITMKNGESWTLIDQVGIDRAGILRANSPSHEITINQLEE